MHTLRLLFIFTVLSLITACNAPAEEAGDDAIITEAPQESKTIEVGRKALPTGSEPNPAAEGFNRGGSDNMAIMLADSVMKYHGGRKAWDETQFLAWNFFGARTLSWDKFNSRVRIDVPQENTVYLLDYSGEEPKARVRIKGDEVKDAGQLAELAKKANSIFINDAFWLVHQFKLKDSGVTLKYAGEVRTDPQAKRPSHIIDQTFAGVGDTPGNRYRLYIDKVTYRINTWQFFKDAADTEPAIETPWNDYLPHGDIILSGDRGGRFQLTDIAVKQNMDPSLFTSF